MKYTIKSRKLGKDVTFTRPGAGYIYVDLNGQHGSLGQQICRGGELMGDTIAYHGEDWENFKYICRRWWKAHLRNLRVYGV